MNGDTGSNRDSIASNIDAIDIKTTGSADLSDGTLKGSRETIIEKAKKKTTTTKKTTTVIKKKVASTSSLTPGEATSATSTSRSSSTKSRASTGGSTKTKPPTSGTPKTKTTKSTSSTSGVFDRLSGKSASVRRVTSKESVRSQDSAPAAEEKPARVSGANKLALNRAANQKTSSRKSDVTDSKSSNNINGTVTMRRSTSNAGATSRPSSRASIKGPRESADLDKRASFLKQMIGNKTKASS